MEKRVRVALGKGARLSKFHNGALRDQPKPDDAGGPGQDLDDFEPGYGA
jgi:hypothetical protein